MNFISDLLDRVNLFLEKLFDLIISFIKSLLIEPITRKVNTVFRKKNKDEPIKDQTVKPSFSVMAKAIATKLLIEVQKAVISLKQFNPKEIILIPILLPISLIKILRKESQTLFFWTLCVSFVFASFAIFELYNFAHKVYEEAYVKNKVKSHIPDDKKKRYHLLDQRFIYIDNISMPLYIESAASARNVLIDINIQTSNRFIREFLSKKEVLVKNQITSAIEPTVKDFPLKVEGKQIIKEKIKDEINVLIHEQGIEGNIEDVFINNIVEN